MILDGLWQLKNETLGGLSPGVTYTKGRVAPVVNCYYSLLLTEKGVSAPKGSAKQCY